MSRIGKKPIALPANVTVSVTGRVVTVEAAGKKLAITHRPEVKVGVDTGTREVTVTTQKTNDRRAKAMHGLTRALINNMVIGVTQGFTRDLEINGVGWGAQVQGKRINLKVGYADVKFVDIPEGVTVVVETNKIKVSGTDKQKVGQVAAEIRSKRPPEPYNGKGIKYAEEVIVRKEGKAFAGGG